ncbi:M1 family metallopeptidase [Bizionia gelidisalsuginis]|uniref:Aminopeptidase N n=1 Tax=Bizionia gelidisalsuginis TaxID=291188 RepID=A0ABY3MEJ3_9FLAO|nr:M1 family metallopeptidase [Bizionia gelidisalsuginis]TYC18002.1 M1 family metallopeptidase [Bizionia gelidisalsuginis]
MKHLLFFILFSCSFLGKAQQTSDIDFKKAIVDLNTIDAENKSVNGSVIYSFDVLKTVDSFYLDTRNSSFSKVLLNNKVVKYRVKEDRFWVLSTLKPSMENTLEFSFYSRPKKALYVINSESEEQHQIWTQGQGQYTSNWLPSIDDTNDKIEFDICVTYKNNFEVIANGKLIKKESTATHTTWQYDMKQPMSSYLVALAIGKYNKIEELSASKIPLRYYYYPKDSLKVESTYRYSKQMFDFLETEIGVAYPWQNYKQVPVKDFLYAGMENTGTTIFSDAFVVDSTAFKDRNYVNINAHELAHQWFGNLVTATKSKHHWLQEGFATYYALLAERDVFGEDFYFWRLHEYAQELLEQEQAGEGTALLDPKASSVTFYKKGAWVLEMLREKVGEKAFKDAVKKYLNTFQFKNVETDYFFKILEQTSNQDLSAFKLKWLESADLPITEMTNHLINQSESIATFFKYDCYAEPDSCKKLLLTSEAVELKSKIIPQLKGDIPAFLWSETDLKVRQAIAKSFTVVPLELKTQYETFLEDNSYATKEVALYTLWVNFPESRLLYLEKTANINGFNDKNIRLLWLVLALNTEGVANNDRIDYYAELIEYTSPNFDFNVRQNALSYLQSLDGFNDTAIKNVILATTHHNWRFKKSAKSILKSLSENEKYKDIITNLEQEKP